MSDGAWTQKAQEEQRKVALQPLPDSSKERVKAILSTDFKIQKLMGGNIEGYPSPSEARLALLNLLCAYQLTDEECLFIMNATQGLNWHEKEHLRHSELDIARKNVTKVRKIYG